MAIMDRIDGWGFRVVQRWPGDPRSLTQYQHRFTRPLSLVYVLGLVACLLIMTIPGSVSWLMPAFPCVGSVVIGLYPLAGIAVLAWVAYDRRRRYLAYVASCGTEVCLECGYRLVGLPAEGACPECGRAYHLEKVKEAWENAGRAPAAGS